MVYRHSFIIQNLLLKKLLHVNWLIILILAIKTRFDIINTWTYKDMKDTVSHVSDIANESNVSSFSIPVKLWVFD